MTSSIGTLSWDLEFFADAGESADSRAGRAMDLIRRGIAGGPPRDSSWDASARGLVRRLCLLRGAASRILGTTAPLSVSALADDLAEFRYGLGPGSERYSAASRAESAYDDRLDEFLVSHAALAPFLGALEDCARNAPEPPPDPACPPLDLADWTKQLREAVLGETPGGQSLQSLAAEIGAVASRYLSCRPGWGPDKAVPRMAALRRTLGTRLALAAQASGALLLMGHRVPGVLDVCAGVDRCIEAAGAWRLASWQLDRAQAAWHHERIAEKEEREHIKTRVSLDGRLLGNIVANLDRSAQRRGLLSQEEFEAIDFIRGEEAGIATASIAGQCAVALRRLLLAGGETVPRDAIRGEDDGG